MTTLTAIMTVFGAEGAFGPPAWAGDCPPLNRPYQTGNSAWLDNLLAMNSRGERMRKPECGWMLL